MNERPPLQEKEVVREALWPFVRDSKGFEREVVVQLGNCYRNVLDILLEQGLKSGKQLPEIVLEIRLKFSDLLEKNRERRIAGNKRLGATAEMSRPEAKGKRKTLKGEPFAG